MTHFAPTATTAEDWNCLFDAVKFHLLNTEHLAASAAPKGLLRSASGIAACNCMQDCVLVMEKLQALLAEERAHVLRLEQERSRQHRRASTPMVRHLDSQSTLPFTDHHAS